MSAVVNYHVVDPTNIGDLLSAPINYFPFPGLAIEQADIRSLQPEHLAGKHIIIGGGGLLFTRFLESIRTLIAAKQGTRLIAWGVGQQLYAANPEVQAFNYASYLDAFDLIGIRDFGLPYDWVPCASCMHPSFDKPRTIQHDYVVFSHKKFQLRIDRFPRMTNDETNDFDAVLDFLGSGETILTSSYHGAYWGTLLGRKVMAFPFSSKFQTLRYTPVLYPACWQRSGFALKLFQKTLYQRFNDQQLVCRTQGWREQATACQTYPDSLAECRDRNRWFYGRVMDLMTERSAEV